MRTFLPRRPIAALLTGLLLSLVAAGPAAAQQQVEDTLGSGAALTGPVEVAYGEDIRISGTGYLTPQGEPSVMIVLLDARFSGDPDTVHTTREVINPLTGTPDGDTRLHAIVEADAEGSWEAVIPFPTEENSNAGTEVPAWEPGSTHELRVLTGTYRPGDHIRSTSVEFTITGEDGAGKEEPEPAEPEPSDPGEQPEPPANPGAPEWPHITVVHDSGAVAFVERDIGTEAGGTLRIRGEGWTNQAGTSGSTIAVKLNRSQTAQYTRTGGDVVVHPSAGGDDTIWALLAPENPESHRYVFQISNDGSFEVQLPAPEDLAAGQYLSVLFQSGLFQDGDVSRAVTSQPLVVGGEPFEGETGMEEEPTCESAAAVPSLEIGNPTVGFGETLTVHGSGWCHPEANRGASVIAIKIDEGAYSRLDDSLHQNRTIWYIVDDADPATGDFTVEIDLPDGTAATSEPALPEGAHTLRLLTGSLKPGDAPRTILSEEFVIGEYQPLAPPEPPEYHEHLTDSTQGAVRISRSARYVEVAIPGAEDGDWIYLMGFAEDGSPRYWWGGTWFQVAGERVRAPLAETTMPLPEDSTKLAVLSGNQGELGLLLGWKWLAGATVQQRPAPEVTGDGSHRGTDGTQQSQRSEKTANNHSTGGDSANSSQPRAQQGGLVQNPQYSSYSLWGQPVQYQQYWVPEVEQAPGAPAQQPEPPRETDLNQENTGEITVWLEDTELILELGETAPGDWVFLHLFPGAQPLGWIEVDDHHRVRLEVAGMPPGEYSFSVQDREGELIAWAELISPQDEEPAAETVALPHTPPAEPQQPQAVPASSSGGLLGHADWVLIALGAGALFGVALAMLITTRRSAVAEGAIP
ncbi:hypothetical protein [Nesterenkonia ebinurensis]|uniref:hypothetical protein n=1 Tax=Nesterenkonia ebinurensis TaxID=2608252 RepID=UPI00123CD3CF|nr:hypothetical protein [Nesterenkonia ebinurensis]